MLQLVSEIFQYYNSVLIYKFFAALHLEPDLRLFSYFLAFAFSSLVLLLFIIMV